MAKGFTLMKIDYFIEARLVVTHDHHSFAWMRPSHDGGEELSMVV